MEENEDAQAEAVSMDTTNSKAFTFSNPNLVPSSPKIVNFGINSEHVFDASAAKKSVFTFAAPMAILQPTGTRDEPASEINISDGKYKPMISRMAFKPPSNVFAQALKDTTMFEQLKKNSRSQPSKINLENSITCTNVPAELLTKATATEYFSSFGTYFKMTIKVKRQIIVVVYATKEEANNAYYKCGEYMGKKFNVEWSRSTIIPKSPTKKKELQKNIVSHFLKASDEEIKLELDAMTNLEYNLHNNFKDNPENVPVKKRKQLPGKRILKLAMRVEKAAPRIEKHKADNQISDLMPNASVEELQTIIRQPAATSEDKYKMLEARDRLLRLKQVKSHTLEAAQVMTGTCPDMCPEKERLFREANRQVALYEQLDTPEYGINHATAVKQYSRSSADQEEPLAHDLRPVKSLKMTMSYLLHEIANLCDLPGTNLGEWYHFMWDRTRGIRKDITQQELCSIDSVDLVEQCARFHIVCSERLCAEAPSIFDKKINSDNLTKCLQSLKYMYNDLRLKEITCENEPEFRAYIILLNLNNGNFMWDLQRLPTSIQKSPEVRFALDVYSALEANNYYRFFKLVRNTTFLNACILLRYFNQVRLKAISVMIKAHCRTTTSYPLYELIDILGYEDENEAIDFCEKLGLNVSRDELHVLLNRQNFTMPMLNIKQNRACNLIESKRTKLGLSTGQCIAGEKMPERTYKNHKPHSSFDSRGYLLLESINTEDQIRTALKQRDPYEFVDEDTVKIPKPLWSSEKSQLKPEKTTSLAQTSYKPAKISELNANAFTTVKSEPNFFFITKPSTRSNADDKPEANDLSRLSAKKQSTTFNAKQQDNVLITNQHKEPSVFGGSLNNPKTMSRTTNIFSKPLENKDVPSPFAMATNKSLFSGAAQGNIFARKTPSTVLSSSHSNTQVTSQPFGTSNVTSSTTDDKIQSESEQYQRRQQKLAELEEAKRMQEINEEADTILNYLQTEITEAFCSDMLLEELGRMKTLDSLTEETSNQILSEILQEMCRTILTNEIIHKQKLQEVSTKVRNRVILKYFRIWKQYIYQRRERRKTLKYFNMWRQYIFNKKQRKRKEQRKALDDTPVWLQNRSIQDCARLLYSKEQNLVIRSMCKRRNEEEVAKPQVDFWAPVEVIIYAGIKENLKSLDIDVSPSLYWKLIIAWPDLQNEPIIWHHKKIVNQYLSPENYAAEPIIKVYRPNQIETIHICIRQFEGSINEHHLIGSDALLFIAAASENRKSVVKRLTKIILSRQKLMPVPLVFVILGVGDLKPNNTDIVSNLEALLESGYLSEYTIIYERNIAQRNILNLMQSAILWLSVNRSPPNPLEMDYLKDVYDTCLTEELWLRILGDSAFNTKLAYALKDPNFIINLHNEAVTHLIDVILDPESLMYAKFSPELKNFLNRQYMIPCSYEYFDDSWKEENYRVKIENVMSSFILPQWKHTWPTDDADTLRENVAQYSQEALAEFNTNFASFNILSNLFLTAGTSTVSNFIDVLLYIVKEKVGLLNENFKVIYNKNHVKHFRTLPWWFKSNILAEYTLSAEDFSMMEEEPILKKQRLSKSPKSLSETDRSSNEFEPLSAFCENMQKRIMEVHHTSKIIEDCLKTHREESSLFEEKLRKALLDDV